MTISRSRRHYIGKLCDCGNRNVITHSPTRIAMTKSYDPKDDFVPLESVLEDYTETEKLHSHNSGNNNCCIHGIPCFTASRTCLSSRSSSCNGSRYQNLDDRSACIRKRSTSSQHRGGARSNSPTMKEKAYEKVRIDQKSGSYYAKQSIKTRWPLTELLADIPCATSNSQTSSPGHDHNNNQQQQQCQDGKETFYDYFSDVEKDEHTLGRRKNKKQNNKRFDDYPKLESVLEDTGYIELKVSKSEESSLTARSNGQPSARRKSKKTRRNSNSAWLNLPYADLGYLEDKHGGGEKSENNSARSNSSSIRTNITLSEEEFVSQASDLEMICRYYLGHRTLNEAENGKFFADSCFFYHLLPNFKGDFAVLPKCVRLYALYITPTKKFKHYAIIKRGDEYCVECDEKRRFSSLNELVRFYALNKCFNGRDGNMQRFPGD